MLFATKSEPDEVDRSPRSEEQTPQEEIVVGVEPVIQAKANSTPDEQTGDEIPHDRPEGALFVIRCHQEQLSFERYTAGKAAPKELFALTGRGQW